MSNNGEGGLIYIAIFIIWAIYSFISWLTKQAKEDKNKGDYAVPKQFRSFKELKEPFGLRKVSLEKETASKRAKPEPEIAGQKEESFNKEESVHFLAKKTAASGSNILKNIGKKHPLVAAMIFREILERKE